MTYAEFLARKAVEAPRRGLEVVPALAGHLRAFQSGAAAFALEAGSSLCALGTGLGKTAAGQPRQAPRSEGVRHAARQWERPMTNVLSDRVVWGYAESDDAEGWTAAKDRDDAIDHAYEQAWDQGRPASIVEGRWVDMGACAVAAVGLDDLLERMDERAVDDGFGAAEDPVFEIADAEKGEAEGALGDALRAWAARYVKGCCWEAIGRPIAVDVCRAPISPETAGPTNWEDEEDGTPRCCEPLVGGAECSKHPKAEA